MLPADRRASSWALPFIAGGLLALSMVLTTAPLRTSNPTDSPSQRRPDVVPLELEPATPASPAPETATPETANPEAPPADAAPRHHREASGEPLRA